MAKKEAGWTKAEFLSGITGLPVTKAVLFPELTRGGQRFSYRLTLGGQGREYGLDINTAFKDEWKEVEENLVLRFNGQEIYSEGGWSSVCDDPPKRNMVADYLDKHLDNTVGGPDTEVPFMDYESFSLDGLRHGGENYFANPYLILMTHMKEVEGLQMPPILGKRESIRKPMLKGDVPATRRAVSGALVIEGAGLDGRCQAHMRAEGEVIQTRAAYESDKRDKSKSVAEVFGYRNTQIVEGKRSVFRPYNILVVENDLRGYLLPTMEVKRHLTTDGRYKGTTLLPEFNLSAAMEVCKSDRVDLVLMDWRKPSNEEVLMARYENRNPLFDMYHGPVQAAMGFDDDGVPFVDLPDGRRIDFGEGLRKEAERMDIRSRWMDMIAEACRAEGVAVPPHHIIRSQMEMETISLIVSQKLGNPLR